MLCYYAAMERSILGKGWSFPIVSDLYGNIALSSYEKNVEESIKDPNSIYNFFKKLIKVFCRNQRFQQEALIHQQKL